MERTESTVVQVSPAYENDKIKEMEMFGWNLINRQEIHEEGEAYSRPSFLDSSEYVIKTKVSNYVKLHFARNLNMPNIDQVKQIESEYFSLPFPEPPSLTWPVIVTGFFLLFLLGVITGGIPSDALVVYLPGVALGCLWINSRIKKRKAAGETCKQSLQRMEELSTHVKALS